MVDNEYKIIQGLVTLFEKLVSVPKQHQKKIAIEISLYCESILNKSQSLSKETEELLVSCLDLNHWGWEKLPPTLTISDIKRKLIPETYRLLAKRKITCSP